MIETLNQSIVKAINSVTDTLGFEVYVVGGYVRDYFLQRTSKDIDFTVVDPNQQFERPAIKLASELAKILNIEFTEFENFGTVMFMFEGLEYELIGARKESYSRDSRNPIIENGSLQDDQERRDLTINALAVNVKSGKLMPISTGVSDLQNGILRTVGSSDITFNDDPLRMLRVIRFKCQLGFSIEENTWNGICKNVNRIKIISYERIWDELFKILKTNKSALGFKMLYDSGLLKYFLPELTNLKSVKEIGSITHKDNFSHTLSVLSKLETAPIYIKLAALFHDTGKPAVRQFIDNRWTFWYHEAVSVNILKEYNRKHNILGKNFTASDFEKSLIVIAQHETTKSFTTLANINEAVDRLKSEYKLETLNSFVQEKFLSKGIVSKNRESALRRFVKDTTLKNGEMIYSDVLLFMRADNSSMKYPLFYPFISMLFNIVEEQCAKIIKEDEFIKNFRPAIMGAEIMKILNIPATETVGKIKTHIENAILDGVINNTYEDCYSVLIEFAKSEFNLEPK